MRDHIFELLRSSFFPKWKQRHQDKYTFNKGMAVLMMPPPCSSEIQESETGSWHVPMEKSGDERDRIWLCIGRMGSCKERHEDPMANGAVQAVSPSEASTGAEQRRPEDKAGLVTGKRKDKRLITFPAAAYICQVAVICGQLTYVVFLQRAWMCIPLW